MRKSDTKRRLWNAERSMLIRGNIDKRCGSLLKMCLEVSATITLQKQLLLQLSVSSRLSPLHRLVIMLWEKVRGKISMTFSIQGFDGVQKNQKCGAAYAPRDREKNPMFTVYR